MDRKINQDSFKKICSQVSSKNSALGGGAVSALTGALAASLVVKVAVFTLGRKEHHRLGKKIEEIKKESSLLREAFQDLASDDYQAFQDFAEEKKAKKKIEKIIDIPLEIARKALRILEMASFLAEKGNRNLISDSHCALELATAAFHGGLEIVRVNLVLIEDSKFEEETREEIEKLLDIATELLI